jgi:tetratricopeptide (TPR) repeat protein
MEKEQARREKSKIKPPLRIAAVCLASALLAFGRCAGASASTMEALSGLHYQRPDSNTVPLVNPLELTGRMEAWVRRVAPERASPEIRLRRLLDGLLDPKGLKIEQVQGPTETAAQAFENRRANCAAFAHLVVTLAREVGLQTYFVYTIEAEGYKEEDDFRIAAHHLAAGYGPASKMTVLDFGGLTETQPGQYRIISDRTAAALLHSNRGVEELLNRRIETALTWLEAAILLDPGLDVAWTNLGVGLRRAGHFAAAERAHRKAIAINPNLACAKNNLTFLLYSRRRLN